MMYNFHSFLRRLVIQILQKSFGKVKLAVTFDKRIHWLYLVLATTVTAARVDLGSGTSFTT